MPDFDRDLTLAELLSEEDRKKLAGFLEILIGAAVTIVPAASKPRPGASRVPLVWDLEPVGYLEADAASRPCLEAAAGLIHMLFRHAARYRLASDLHERTSQSDFEELREKHTALQRSEARYKALAEQLEERVAEQVQTIRSAQGALYQNEKLASVGRLAAGMAHEINNPLAFVISNFSAASSYLKKFKELQPVVAASNDQGLKQLWQRLKLDFVLEDFGELLTDSKDGLKRVAKIVADLKAFSNIDSQEWGQDLINERLRITLKMLAPELPPEIRIVQEIGELPALFCSAGRLGQLFYNLLLNAAQAIAGPGEIKIRTWSQEQEIRVSIRDSGQGIAPADLSRIFDPFFTTKEVGRGTGLGLSVCHDIVKAHGGRIEVESRPGEGTLFTVSLPLRHA